ncbi:hypothetical protein [Paraburkholderia sediminicola]|uniref:hypothetical protein n=1 Tax=Paraburkholderia sediminicola TaxID=458836 RepID=UPI0038BD98C8
MKNSPCLEKNRRKVHVNVFVDEALRQSLRQQPREIANNSTFIYGRAFPIGSALADIFVHRCTEMEEEGPTGLAWLIEKLVRSEIDGASSPEAAARHALFSGFCWEIGNLLRLGGNGGFRFKHHDESAMLANGIVRGREGDGDLAAQLLQPDDEDEVCHA